MADIIKQSETLASQSANKKPSFHQDGLLSLDDANTALNDLKKQDSNGSLIDANKKLETALQSMTSYPSIFTNAGGSPGINWGNAQQMDASIKIFDTSYQDSGTSPTPTSTATSTSTVAPTEGEAQPTSSVQSLGTDAQTQGNKIVLSNGQVFNVHGVDIGGDLVPEDWMDGTQSGLGNNGRSGYQLLVNRFGQAQANKLINERQDNWITPSDMQNMKSMGYNTIRVPFSDQNFPKNTDGSYDFSAMDKIVNEAGAAGLHVIPDFHVWEGQDQNYQAISGNTAQGAQERQDSSNLLQAFAQHYKGNGTILAIDEDNEATGSPNDQLQKQLYGAIRQGDLNRAVMVESVPYGNFSQDGFKNAIYSDHYPPLDSKGLSSYINQFSDSARPVVIGEIHGEPDQLGPAVKQLNAAGIGWMNWTYKGVNIGNWALENLPKSSLNLQTASYQEIEQAWSKQALQAVTPNTALINAYTVE